MIKVIRDADRDYADRAQYRETFRYHAFPCEHWRSLRTIPLQHLMRESFGLPARIGMFPDGSSALLGEVPACGTTRG